MDHRHLFAGQYFGEISMFRGCLTSAKVESTNYCTFARICKSEFDHRCKDIIDDMVEEIPNYSDSLIDYKVSVLSQIPWLTEDTISSFMDSEQIEDILRLI